MNVKLDSITKDLKEAIKTPTEKTKPYDTTAEVLRVEGDIVWVHIAGGVNETPVKKTIDAKKGDTVQVRVSGGNAWLTGNATAPPTDDYTANIANRNAKKAQLRADSASEMANKAQASADGKNTIYYDATQPIATEGGFKVGDTWFNSAEDNAIYRYNGTAWVKEEIGEDAIAELSIKTAHIQDGAITNAKVGNLDAGKITTGTLSTNVLNVAEIISTGGIATDSEVASAKSDAEKVATNYLYYNSSTGLAIADSSPSTATKKVQIQSTGVRIQQSANNYADVTASGLEVTQSGSSVASFSTVTRIGTITNNQSRVSIQPSGLSVIYRVSGTDETAFQVNKRNVSIAGTLGVGGFASFGGDITVTEDITAGGSVTASSFIGNATTSTRASYACYASDGTLGLTAYSSNEVNFLGSSTATGVYIGYRSMGSTNVQNYYFCNSTSSTTAKGNVYCGTLNTNGLLNVSNYGVNGQIGAVNSGFFHIIITPASTPIALYNDIAMVTGNTIGTSNYPCGKVILGNGQSVRAISSAGGTTTYNLIQFTTSNEVQVGNSTYNTHLYGNTVKSSPMVTSSDIRLKTNINQLDNNADNVILALDTFDFNFKEEAEENDGRLHYGISAQQLKELLEEENVDTSKTHIVQDYDNYLQVSYTELIPMLIHLCQSQQREIDELKEKVQ